MIMLGRSIKPNRTVPPKRYISTKYTYFRQYLTTAEGVIKVTGLGIEHVTSAS